MEQHSRTNYGMRGALPISDSVTLGDLSQEPESGEQYMLRVMMESGSIPKVSIAKDRHLLLQATTQRLMEASDGAQVQQLPDAVRPSDEWLDSFAQYFHQQRAKFKSLIEQTVVSVDFRVPESGQVREWKSFCYEASGNSPTNRAMLNALATIDQSMAMRLIKCMTTWMATDKLRRQEGVWLWYLILKLDGLLDHEDTHALRELCRRLRKIRLLIGQQHQENSSVERYRSNEIAALNILIASVTRGYLQRDLE
ncbi:hypothetical protein GQ54DRAFT_298581 [Martensiomyces pterosporus]|nr:hypothetical protein GQ54DRAFT_298581 [Martensiomyces pterosporus]